ncbi:MAG: 16S rRNA (cytidine(1402)-2'-O)-methyltransferase [Verrucomicrobiota bacterium]
MPESPQNPSLTLITTPIGNLGDISERAIKELQAATCIACEDTRVTGKLLSKLGIETKPELLSYRDENEKYLAEQLADRIEAGEPLCLVADAGTPAISDPGFRLVRECRKRGILVSSTPGPSAVITALSISGLPSDGFFFGGFLPPKSAARKRFFVQYRNFGYTIVLYESCHRIEKFLNELVEVLGPDRCISICRELTKLHETVHSGPAAEVAAKIKKGSLKGEFVALIAKENFQL